MMFRTLIDNLKERHFRGMRRQTQQLDPQTRGSLREFLEDVPAEVEDVSRLDADLDQAHAKLAQLLEKEAFVGKRLTSYRAQLQQYHEHHDNKETSSSTTENDSTTEKETGEEGGNEDALSAPEEFTSNQQQQQQQQQENYEKHLHTLKQIELSHKTMQRGIEVLQERIELLEHRKAELQQMTDECAIVYQTAAELENLQLAPNDTNELFESVGIPSATDEEGVPLSLNDVEAAENAKDNKEELGELELAKEEVASKEASVVVN
jgi:hypothetical protein